MSWPNSFYSAPDPNDTHSNTYPLTNAAYPFSSPPQQPPNPGFPVAPVTVRPPRLPSPQARFFRDSTNNHRGRPIPNLPDYFQAHNSTFAARLNYDDTLRDVQSALHNADMALRNAQAAFRHTRANTASNSPVVDLTGPDDFNVGPSEFTPSTTINDAPFSRQITRPRRRVTSQQQNQSRSQPDPPTAGSGTANDAAYDDRPDFSSTRLPPIQPPSFHASLLVIPPPSARGAPDTAQAERNAVRRQRQARRDWERVERRNIERARQQAQADAQNQSNTQPEPSERPIENTAHPTTDNSDAASIASLFSSTSDGDSTTDSPTEALDLTQPEEETILAKQQQAAIAAQPKPKPDGPIISTNPSSLSTYKCAICMDSPTNATTTICGHLFCHKCILDSLEWSERQRREDVLHPRQQKGLCPVCRKPLQNKEISATSRSTTGGLVNLEIKKVPRKIYRDNKEREAFLASLDTDKGKQRAATEDIDDVDREGLRMSSDEDGIGDDDGLPKSRILKKRKRRDLSRRGSRNAEVHTQ